MIQPNKNSIKTPKKRKKRQKISSIVKSHPKFGTSKLESYFAHEFLDKLGVKYEYQFEAKEIGRFYDFYLPNSNLIIEIDGDFWHANPEKYKDEELRGHQRRARRVDEYKNKWALMHCIPILRIWESDIRKDPKKVMNMLKESLNIQEKQKIINENKRKRH